MKVKDFYFCNPIEPAGTPAIEQRAYREWLRSQPLAGPVKKEQITITGETYALICAWEDSKKRLLEMIQEEDKPKSKKVQKSKKGGSLVKSMEGAGFSLENDNGGLKLYKVRVKMPTEVRYGGNQ